MLIERNSLPALNDIVSVKLLNGDEIIGKLLKTGDGSVGLGKPVAITLQPVDQKRMGLVFIPVLGSVEPDVSLTIPDSAIAIRPVKTSQQVLTNYIEMTSGIIPAGAGSIIT